MELRPLAAAAVALAPLPALATDYLSVEQAQALIFPDAQRFEARHTLIEPAVLQKLGAGASTALASGTLHWTLATREGQVLGAVVIDEVIGKFERIRYAVGLNPDGRIRQIEILSYRESHGGEVRYPAWRKQFQNKSFADAIKVGEDIANISGATLSCTHITEGVRRLVTVLESLRQTGRWS